MPDITYESEDSVPEGLKEFAKEVEGKFVINVAPQAKLQEFRDKNIDLMKRNTTLEEDNGRFSKVFGEKSVDEFQAEYTTLVDLAQQVEDGKLKKSDAVQREVENRLTAAKEASQQQLAEFGRRAEEAEAAATDWKRKFEDSIVDRAITEAVLKPESGMKPEAIEDIMTRARREWRLNTDGQIVALQGDEVRYGPDGVHPMTPLEWLKGLRETAPHLAIQSSGGGAAGGTGKEKYGGYSKEEFEKLPAQTRMRLARKHNL